MMSFCLESKWLVYETQFARRLWWARSRCRQLVRLTFDGPNGWLRCSPIDQCWFVRSDFLNTHVESVIFVVALFTRYLIEKIILTKLKQHFQQVHTHLSIR